MRRLPLLLTTVVLCGGLAAVGAVDRGQAGTRAPAADTARATGGINGDSAFTRAIAADQQRLRQVPGDAAGWARLGTEYVEQARLTADPSYYPKADEALQ